MEGLELIAFNIISSVGTARSSYIEAIQKAGALDRQAIRDAVAATEYNGASGFTTFDENGDAMKTFVKIQVKDGAFQIADF